ncbi:MAG: GntG family PLP-dependent aldolase [Anaerolineae bacterium]
MPERIMDLRSDTLSQPTPAMLEAILSARLGDDSRDGDPTVMELEALAAELMGKEAAMLTASGTMSNLIAMRAHAEAGAPLILESQAHIYMNEFGGYAAVCGLQPILVPGRRGAMDLDALRAAVRQALQGFPARGLVCLENTHNAAGGTVLTPEFTAQACEIAHQAGLPVHLDGARIFNAAVALGVPAKELAAPADSVCFCLSKGLSAPVGSLLAGSREFISRARRIRRALGGSMRQAGVIAAPGLVALRTMVGRLAEDHANARYFAEQLSQVEGLHIDMETVQTNMVNVDVAGLGTDAATFARFLAERGVRGLPGLGTIIRFVTYRGITRDDVAEAAGIIRQMARERPWQPMPAG